MNNNTNNSNNSNNSNNGTAKSNLELDDDASFLGQSIIDSNPKSRHQGEQINFDADSTNSTARRNLELDDDASFLGQSIAHFNEHAYSWWDKNGPLKTLHQINPVRLAWILQYTSLKNQKVLDIGCGGGILTHSMAQEGAHALGIDLAPELIEVAKMHLLEQRFEQAEKNTPSPLLNIDYQCVDLKKYAEEKLAAQENYDIITCMEMLEHVDTPEDIIQDAAHILKKGGLFFASTIHQSYEAYFKAIIAAEYILKIVPKYTHFYKQFIKPSQLNEMAEKAGLRVLAIKGLSYQPFFKPYAKLSDDVNVGYMMVFEKI